MFVQFFVSEIHYADHLLPVEEEMSRRGWATRFTSRVSELGRGPVVVASYGDLCRVRGNPERGPLVLCEHGAGQTYSGAGRDAYADGVDLAGVSLCLVPGPHAYAKRVRVAGPRTRVAQVGLTKLHDLLSAREGHVKGVKPTIAFGWHWDCRVCPETRSTWSTWMGAVDLLRRSGNWNVVGHGHPREWFRLLTAYSARGIHAEPKFDRVMGQADLYCVDNSSTAFEALAAGVPVLLLESWSGSETHGLRFGPESRCMDRCTRPDMLREAVELVLSDAGALERQSAVLAHVYAPPGGPGRAADELETTISNFLP